MTNWLSKDWGAWWTHPNGQLVGVSQVPNYLTDLNAMHEAEKMLDSFTLRHRYFEELQKIRSRVPELNGRTVVFCECIMATAAQRAEAFLRTLNLWTP